jgi:AcrR family transcriptional regulator
VNAAGVNERMFCRHFGTEDGLYAAALQHQHDGLTDAWFPILDKGVTLEPYQGMPMALTGFINALGRWRTLLLPETCAPVARLKDLYEREQWEGVLRDDCPFLLARATAMGAH